MESWKTIPLGFAVVDETRGGSIAIHHVSISEDTGVTLSGAWLLDSPEPSVVRSLCTHRIVVGTRDGIERLENVLEYAVGSAELSGLVAACEKAESDLSEMWTAYRDEQPQRRASLKPLNAPTWPVITEDGEAALILQRVGMKGFPDNCPDEMKDVLALANLVSFVMRQWFELESERLTRPYLRGDSTQRCTFPKTWLEQNPPYWPKAHSSAP